MTSTTVGDRPRERRTALDAPLARVAPGSSRPRYGLRRGLLKITWQ
ncbi:hypothetical protein ACH4ZU_09960 [Streptomyces sp. NPDC020472]